MNHRVLATLNIEYWCSLLHFRTEVLEEGRGMLENSKEKTYKICIGQPWQGRILSKKCLQYHDSWRRIKSN
jgi:hypothetical protein